MKAGKHCQKFVKHNLIFQFSFFSDSCVTGLLDTLNFVKTHLDFYTRDYGACCSFPTSNTGGCFSKRNWTCAVTDSFIYMLRRNRVCIVYLWTVVFFISLFISVLSIVVGLCYIPDMGNNVPSGEY